MNLVGNAIKFTKQGEIFVNIQLVKTLEAKIQNPNLLRELQNTNALLYIHANDISALAQGSYLIDVLSEGRHVVKKFLKM